MNTVEVHGTVAEEFDAVRAEFLTTAVADEAGEAGAQLTVYVHGRQVVDLWFGNEVTGDTLTGVYSCTKAPPPW
nr:serine hydrolase [Nocardia tengchongensis]